jgi:hypothetical protein
MLNFVMAAADWQLAPFEIKAWVYRNVECWMNGF